MTLLRRSFHRSFAALAAVLGFACAASTAPPRAPGSGRASSYAPIAAHLRAQSEILSLDADDAVWGAADASVTVLAFLDFECPHCRAAHSILRELRSRMAPADLRIVFKHYPIPSHQHGFVLALAAQAVSDAEGPAAFVKFAERLYDSKDTRFSADDIIGLAERSGVVREAFVSRLMSRETRAHVFGDIGLAQRIGVRAVPALLVNGISLLGVTPLDELERVIGDELAAARDARARGVEPHGIYESRVQVNWRLRTSIQI